MIDDKSWKSGNLSEGQVEIVFSVEDVRILQIAVKSETCLDGTVYDALVEHRQRTGHFHTDRTGMSSAHLPNSVEQPQKIFCFRGELYGTSRPRTILYSIILHLLSRKFQVF